MYPIAQPAPLRPGAAYDVIVVGARPAGAATAMVLGRRHLRTLLLERNPLGTDTVSTHALTRGGVLQLHRWGLIEDLAAAGTPPVRRTIFQYGDERAVISVKPWHGVDALYAPRRTVLDPLLVEAAVRAGVEVRDRTSVTDVVVRGGRVAGVKAAGPDGAPVELSASLVIGADGIRSTVARSVGAGFARVGQHGSAATYAYWPDLGADGYEWTFRRHAGVGLIPTNDGEVCVFAAASPERVGRGGVARLRDIIAERDPHLADRLRQTSPTGRARTWSGHHGFMRHSHGPGWALVGDAGYFSDPLGTHGLTDALRDAELLGRAASEGLAQASAAALDDSLAAYESLRDRLSVPLFEVADRIGSCQWDESEIAYLLLQLNSATVDEIETLAALDDHVIEGMEEEEMEEMEVRS